MTVDGIVTLYKGYVAVTVGIFSEVKLCKGIRGE
jgi:hypothetical protein